MAKLPERFVFCSVFNFVKNCCFVVLNVLGLFEKKITIHLGRVRLGSIRNKNNWNNASKRLFGSFSGILGFHSGYSTPRSRIAGIYSGIYSEINSYSGISQTNAP